MDVGVVFPSVLDGLRFPRHWHSFAGCSSCLDATRRRSDLSSSRRQLVDFPPRYPWWSTMVAVTPPFCRLLACFKACDPLALCTGSLPSWCLGLSEEFPSLFTLNTRLELLKKTAFGMARAVVHVQVGSTRWFFVSRAWFSGVADGFSVH